MFSSLKNSFLFLTESCLLKIVPKQALNSNLWFSNIMVDNHFWACVTAFFGFDAGNGLILHWHRKCFGILSTIDYETRDLRHVSKTLLKKHFLRIIFKTKFFDVF